MAQALFLSLVLILCAGLTIALTYLPCYATVCTEEHFALQTRLHIAIYYALLASIGGALWLRAGSSKIEGVSRTYLTSRRLPLLGRHVTIGGLLLAFWIVAVTLATTGLWIGPQLRYWAIRTGPLGWQSAKALLTATGVLGHHADILLGLLIIPVSRNSLVGRAFGIHRSTLLSVHKMVAYLLLVAVVAHAAVYLIFMDSRSSADEAKRNAFHRHNPLLTTAEVEEQGSYYASTMLVGVVGFSVMLVIVATALPVVRRRYYDLFYYTHVVSSMVVFAAASFHANTDFYFLLPGLLLWILDWALRLFRGAGRVRKTVTGTLTNVGGGWYKIALPAQARQYNGANWSADSGSIEMQSVQHSPLQMYYLNFPTVSRLQGHPFSAASVGSNKSGPVFLFKKASGSAHKTENQWTWKLGGLVDGGRQQSTEIECHVEGAYTAAPMDYKTAGTVICIVGGTGMTGAHSLALWWLEHRSRDASARFLMVWTVRDRDTTMFEEWTELCRRVEATDNMTIFVHVSSEHGRLDTERVIRGNLPRATGEPRQHAWVYASGPSGLLEHTEDACVGIERELRGRGEGAGLAQSISGMTHYITKYEV